MPSRRTFLKRAVLAALATPLAVLALPEMVARDEPRYLVTSVDPESGDPVLLPVAYDETYTAETYIVIDMSTGEITRV